MFEVKKKIFFFEKFSSLQIQLGDLIELENKITIFVLLKT